MNTAKARIAGIALLDRAFTHLPDDDLETVLSALPDDHVTALQRLAHTSGGSDNGESEPSGQELVDALRVAATKGRMNGNLERIAGVLTDPCLADCVEQLGDKADLPTEDDLLEVAPRLVERHGVGLVRVMLASAVAGEAPASPAIIRILKHDDVLALPAAAPPTATPPPAKAVSPEEAAERERIRERRKEERKAKQAEQAARREQAAKARRGGH